MNKLSSQHVPLSRFVHYSIVLPARNEASALRELIPELRRVYAEADILVVDDGSTDETADVCREAGVKVMTKPYSQGNGAAIKTAAREAIGDIIITMDADGQHRPEDIGRLLNKLSEGYDMVVGARNTDGQAGTRRTLGNYLYNRFASLITGHKIEDLTSGFRAVRADRFREFIHLLPNGFSYPTTITMAFFRSGYSVAYVPINANKRIGKSHLKITRDGIRFLLIIFKVGTLYSPLKVFVPVSVMFFSSGLGYYLFTYFSQGRFTNMGVLLFVTAMLTFLIGLVSEQVTQLLYTTRRAPFRAHDDRGDRSGLRSPHYSVEPRPNDEEGVVATECTSKTTG